MDAWTFPGQPLVGTGVSLVPLSLNHIDALSDAIINPGTWFYEHRGIRTRAAIAELVERNLAWREKGTWIPWVMQLQSNRQVIGMTSFIDPKKEHRQLEIGG